MTIDVLGPACDNAVTARPARTNARGATNTWFTDCTTPDGDDGTVYPADYMNDLLAQFRTAVVSSGITLDNADDMLWRAIQTVRDYYIITTAVVKTVYGTSPDFADLAAAAAWISKYRIAVGGSVTFNLRAGKFTAQPNIMFAHPDGARIVIAGAALSGSISTYSFPATGYSGGTRASDRAAQLAALRAIIQTELVFVGGSGLSLLAPGITVSNLLLTSDRTGSADAALLSVNATATLDNVVAGYAGGTGIAVRGCVVYAGTIGGFGCVGAGIAAVAAGHILYSVGLYGTSCDYAGVRAEGGSIRANGTGIATLQGNAGSGGQADQGGYIDGAAGSTLQYNANGMTIINGCAEFPSGTIRYNAYGFYINKGSIDVTGSAFSGNTTLAGFAQNGALVVGTSASGLSGAVSPAINTLGNNNALIIN